MRRDAAAAEAIRGRRRAKIDALTLPNLFQASFQQLDEQPRYLVLSAARGHRALEARARAHGQRAGTSGSAGSVSSAGTARTSSRACVRPAAGAAGVAEPGAQTDSAVAQAREVLVVLRHALLDRVAVGAARARAPTSRRRPARRVSGVARRAHLVDERELEPLDLLLGRALAQRPGTARRGRCSSQAPLTIAKRLRRAIGSDIRGASVADTAGSRIVSVAVRTFLRLLGFLRPYRAARSGRSCSPRSRWAATVAIPWLTGRGDRRRSTRGDRGDLRLSRARSSPPRSCASVLSVARRLVAGRVSLGVEVDLRNLIYAHLQSLELGFFARPADRPADVARDGRPAGGALLPRLRARVHRPERADDPARARSAMFALQPGLAALALDPGAVRGLVAARYGRRSRPALQEVQQRIAELTADVEENVSGVRVVKAFAAEERQLERFRGTVARVFDQSMIATRLRAFYNPFIGFLPNLGLAVILLVGGRQVISGTLSLGDFTAFYAYLLMLIAPMRQLGIALGLAQRATASGARAVRAARPRAAARVAAGRAAAARGPRARGAARRVVRLRRRARRSLRDVDLVVEAGTTVALVGATGSGKTTLVQLLPRLYDATAGAVLIDGADVRDGRPRARCGARSRSSTTTRSCSRPRVHENIAYGRPDATPRGGRAGGRARAGGRLHRRAARRLRHARRRARADAVGRPAPADRDRARAARRPADPRPRRRDVVGRRLDRAGDQGGAARGDGRPHDVRDRAPALDDRARRRHRRARGRRASPRAARTTSCSSAASCYAEIAEKGLPDQVFLNRNPIERGGGAVSDAPRRRTDELRRRLALDGRARAQAARPARAAAARTAARAVLMFVALLLGDGRRARAAAAGQAGDRRGDHAGRPDGADAGRGRVPRSARSIYWGATYVQTYLVGWVGQRVLQDLRIQLFAHLQTLSVGFYSRRQAGVLISRLTNDVAGARPARLRRRGDAVRLDAHARRHRGDPARCSTSQLALLTFLVFPVLAIGSLAFRIVSADAYRRTREKVARDHRLPAGDAVGHPRRALVRAGARATWSASPSSTRTTARRT